MPKVSAFTKMLPADRAALDEEVRRRCYSDAVGLATWLQARGVELKKSAVAAYAQKLKKRDSSPAQDADPLEAVANAAIDALDALNDGTPLDAWTVVAVRQLQDALINVVCAVHRCRAAHQSPTNPFKETPRG